MDFRELLPDCRTVDVATLLDTTEFAARAPAERPFVAVNFVATIDGRATLDGRSGGLSDDGDRAMFHGLRERVDAVLAGTMTLRVERYGRLVKDPERRRRRVENGHAPEPLACIVTLTGDIPMDIPLLSEPEARVVIFTPRPIEPPPAAQTEVVELDAGELTLTTVMRRLRSHHGVASLLCEGGPTLFAALLRERLVDELFVTVAPQLAGGGHGPTIATGPELPEPAGGRVLWALERRGSLFLRYAVP